MRQVGILAYGSLIDDPGGEIKAATVERLEGIKTPFKVEFARCSRGRGGGPTLVPVQEGGAHVNGVIFVLRPDVSERHAADMLWRRETNQVGSYRAYNPWVNHGPNTVIVESLRNFHGVGVVLYTRIAANIEDLEATKLADFAIASVKSKELAEGRDGISYLIAAKRNGIVTPLSAVYEETILRRTNARSLNEALKELREKS